MGAIRTGGWPSAEGQPTAREFFITPPVGEVFEDKAVIARIEQHIRPKFPQFTLRVVMALPMRQPDEYTVVPMMSGGPHPTDPDAITMLEHPGEEVIASIRAALNEFDPYETPSRLN